MGIYINLICLLVALNFAGCDSKVNLPAAQTVPSEGFGNILFYKPEDFDKVAIVFISAAEKDRERYISLLAEKKAAAFIIDPDSFLNSVKNDGEACKVIGGEIERLDQSLQNTLKFSAFIKPYIIGVGKGAILSFIAQMQSPDRFQGSFSNQVCGLSEFPYCETSNFVYKEIAEEQYGLQLLEDKKEWQNVFASFSQGCSNPSDIKLLNGVKELESPLAQLEEMLDDSSDPEESQSVYELFSEKSGPLVIFVSGDGGWAGIDQETGAVLQEKGNNVLGVNALKYFWDKKTPQETSDYIRDLIADYSVKWGESKIVLLGYSLGANAVPLIYNGLPASLQQKVSSVVLLAPEESTDLEVHITDWIGIDTTPEDLIQLLPEIKKIPEHKILCIKGEEEEAGACDKLDFSKNKVVTLPGGHHFDGDYQKLGSIIADFIKTAGVR